MSWICIATALALSRATLRTIKQNLFWAFAYNVLLIPTVILSPLIPFLKVEFPRIWRVGEEKDDRLKTRR